jgi:hypothetical protein
VAAGVHVPATIGPHNTPLTCIGSLHMLATLADHALMCIHNKKVVDVSQLGHWHNA